MPRKPKNEPQLYETNNMNNMNNLNNLSPISEESLSFIKEDYPLSPAYDKVSKTGYTKTPNYLKLAICQTLNSDYLGLYEALKTWTNSTTGECYPSYDSIIDITKLSRSTIGIRLNKLKEFGFIISVTESGKNNQYYFPYELDLYKNENVKNKVKELYLMTKKKQQTVDSTNPTTITTITTSPSTPKGIGLQRSTPKQPRAKKESKITAHVEGTTVVEKKQYTPKPKKQGNTMADTELTKSRRKAQQELNTLDSAELKKSFTPEDLKRRKELEAIDFSNIKETLKNESLAELEEDNLTMQEKIALKMKALGVSSIEEIDALMRANEIKVDNSDNEEDEDEDYASELDASEFEDW